MNKFKIKNSIINEGLVKTDWPARMQRLRNGKLSLFVGKKFEIWLDGGHNFEASQILKKEIIKFKKKIFLVMGMMVGKDPLGFLRNLIKDIEVIYLLPITDHQYIQPYEIMERLKKEIKTNIKIHCSLDVKEALRSITENYSSGKIIICGSLYLAGEVLKEEGFKIK